MRLLHVYSGNLFGGIEAILVTLARHRDACPELESEFALCFDGRLARELASAGAAVHCLGEVRVSRPHTIRRARRALAALIAARGFDAVIVHAAWSHAMFGTVARRLDVPLVLWAHDVLHGRHWTERWAKRTPPDRVVSNSNFTGASVDHAYPGVPVSVVYPPVELGGVIPTVADRAAVRRELSTPDEAVVIAQACRMDAWKGHDVLIEALGAIRDVRNWVCWEIGGAQRPQEAGYVTSLRDRASRLEIGDRVRFVGERSDVARLLAAADVHCQPNVTPEPFGIAFVEALAAGLPVVTSAFGGALEIVDDTCGRLVPPRDRSALAAALRSLIHDESLRRSLGAAGTRRARTLCDPAAQIQRLRDALVATVGVPTIT
jgi:glycosyltransferase involved in cell wall biosynthesis